MKIYTTIDELPLFNYQKIMETGDYKHLLKKETPVTQKIYHLLSDAWQNINKQIIEYIGISKELQMTMRLEREIVQLKISMVQTGDRSIENLIELKQIELNNLRPKQKASIDDSLVTIETILKISINIFECTVRKYYSYMNYLQKKADGNKKS